MSTRLGVAVARDAVRAVAVRNGTAIWAGEAADLRTLLADAPIRRWPRPVVSVAIGPHASQVKMLAGLPTLDNETMLAGLVRESAGAFFLKNGVPLITTGARRMGEGDAALTLAAAIDRPAVEAVRDACRAGGWTLRHVAPTAVALSRAFEDLQFTWTDGRIVLEIVRSSDGLVSARSRASCAAPEPSGARTPVAGLAALGADAARFADAYGAAMLEDGETFAVDLRASGLLTPLEVLRPFIVPLLIATAGLVLLLLSPLAAVWAGKRAEARIAQVGAARWDVISSALGQLDRVTAILGDAAAFADSRSSATEFLGALARSLPPGSVLVSLEVGDDGGQLVALTDEPGAVVSTVQRLPGVSSAELAGPVAQENTGGRSLQRVAIRFRRSRA